MKDKRPVFIEIVFFVSCRVFLRSQIIFPCAKMYRGTAWELMAFEVFPNSEKLGIPLGSGLYQAAREYQDDRDLLRRLEIAASLNPPVHAVAQSILMHNKAGYADPKQEVADLLQRAGIT